MKIRLNDHFAEDAQVVLAEEAAWLLVAVVGAGTDEEGHQPDDAALGDAADLLVGQVARVEMHRPGLSASFIISLP